LKQLSELTRAQLEAVVLRIRDILWREPVTGRLDPVRSWDVETIESVSGVIADAGLKPDPARPASLTPPADAEEPTAAMRSALEAFIGTIEATGGCVRPERRTINLDGQEIVEFEGHFPESAADEHWLDLADAYLLACRALGREPMVRDMDEDEIPDDAEDAGEP
jgi:hypothetical protein